MVELLGLNVGDQVAQAGRVGQVCLMHREVQAQPTQPLASLPRGVQPYHAPALGDQQLSQKAAAKAGDAGDQCNRWVLGHVLILSPSTLP